MGSIVWIRASMGCGSVRSTVVSFTMDITIDLAAATLVWSISGLLLMIDQVEFTNLATIWVALSKSGLSLRKLVRSSLTTFCMAAGPARMAFRIFSSAVAIITQIGMGSMGVAGGSDLCSTVCFPAPWCRGIVLLLPPSLRWPLFPSHS